MDNLTSMAGADDRSPEQPDSQVKRVHNEARDVDGNVVQVGSVTDDVNVRSEGEATLAIVRKAATTGWHFGKRLFGIALLCVLVFLPVTGPQIISMVGTVGPEDGPDFDTAHVDDCVARRGGFDWSNTAVRDLDGGPATVTVVPCWHRSAMYRVVAITPFDIAEAAASNDGSESYHELQEQACLSTPGWDDGIALSGYDFSPVFCLAFT